MPDAARRYTGGESGLGQPGEVGETLPKGYTAKAQLLRKPATDVKRNQVVPKKYIGSRRKAEGKVALQLSQAGPSDHRARVAEVLKATFDLVVITEVYSQTSRSLVLEPESAVVRHYLC